MTGPADREFALEDVVVAAYDRSMDPSDRPDGSAGEAATPLDDVEFARWNAVGDAASRFAGAVISGDEEGASAADAQMRTIPLDLTRVLNAIHVPDDAGDWAEGLERILRRIPDGWGRWIRVEKGWYPIIVALDAELATIDPGYVVQQVKEKFGGLDVYFEQSGLLCCDGFSVEHPFPPADEDVSVSEWEAAFEEHDRTLEHTSAVEDQYVRQEWMDAALRRASNIAARTCELTGAPGVMMVNRGWLRTLDPSTAPVDAELVEPQPLAAAEPPTLERRARQVEGLDEEVQHWFVVAQRLRQALLDERGRQPEEADQ